MARVHLSVGLSSPIIVAHTSVLSPDTRQRQKLKARMVTTATRMRKVERLVGTGATGYGRSLPLDVDAIPSDSKTRALVVTPTKPQKRQLLNSVSRY